MLVVLFLMYVKTHCSILARAKDLILLMLIHQVDRKGSMYQNKNWVYRSLQSVLVPDQQWTNNFYCSTCTMIKQIYTRWLWLFTAMYSETWAEGKASPGRNICMYTTWGILFASNTSRMYRDAPRQNCELMLCNGSAHLQRTHTGFPHGLWSCWNDHSSFFCCKYFCSSKYTKPLGILEKVWSPQILGRKKHTAEEHECRVTLAKGYIQALVEEGHSPGLQGELGEFFSLWTKL